MLFALKGDDYFKANFMDPDNMLCCKPIVTFLFLVLAGVYIVYILYCTMCTLCSSAVTDGVEKKGVEYGGGGVGGGGII